MSKFLVFGPNQDDNDIIAEIVKDYFGINGILYTSKWYRNGNKLEGSDPLLEETIGLKRYSETIDSYGWNAICSLPAPTQELRDLFDPDYSIYVNTTKEYGNVKCDLEIGSIKNISIIYNFLSEKIK